ncbi:hypothetical protein PX554_09060 [Sphingomonas sp. H39-1-10]|uniref:hypothetical protein n=1 Tax=Sphingomonas pollutisoli TaxID=3030829 RepID=UPI0023B8CA62|nr:hypothetical protein [Sphingomonas pollutisoli]MDF0488277.1 hypothetical protein [Sphingomonas pollutisoli]
MTIWSVLGIAATADRAAIRRAYAKALRVTNPEDDPEGFKALRAAYEMALDWADRASAWDAGESADDIGESGGAGVTLRFDEAQFFEVIAPCDPEPETQAADAPPPSPRFRTGPAAGDPTDAHAPDLAGLFAAEREAGIARLRALLATLERSLRGPWNSDETTLRETFAALLATPALDEIALRADVERAVAELLADTIPRSDAILAEAATAFGWTDERAHAASPAVAAVLARFDEWRLAETLARPGNPLQPAWHSLTRGAGPYWSWRLAAFRPGLESGVATLLGAHGPIAPGIAYSFKADSVARWRRFLSRPHGTLGMLAAMPLALLLYLALKDAFGDPLPALQPWANWAIGLAILLSPCVPFAAQWLRHRWSQAPRPAWLANGWVAGPALVLAGAMLLPESRVALLGLALLTALAWAWMAVAGGTATIAEVRQRVLAGVLPGLLAALFGGGLAVAALDPVHRAALALVFALGATIMVGPLTQGAVILEHVPRWRAAFAVPLVLAIGGLGYGAALLIGIRGAAFYAAALTLVAGLVIVSAAQIAGVRGNREHLALRALKMALVAGFVFAAILSLGGFEDTWAPDRSLRGKTEAALDSHGEQALKLRALRQRVAGFDAIARGNPALWQQIAQAVSRQPDTETATTRVIDLVGAAYASHLPVAPDAALLEEIEIRRLRLLALRGRSGEACAKPRATVDEKALPQTLRDRQAAQTFAIAAAPRLSDAQLTATPPYPPVAFNAMVTGASGLDYEAFMRAADGKAGKAAQCDARIALLTALARAPDRARAAATARIVLFPALATPARAAPST